MNELNICQSCGMPLIKETDFGTNKDGSKEADYCSYCFQNGAFTQDCTLSEMIETNLLYLEEWNKENNTNYTIEEARVILKEYLPTLKRWQCSCFEECGDNSNCSCSSKKCHCQE